MPPPQLELRSRRQAVGARDRVVDARGQHVVHIRINTRRTRWKSRRMDVNASASHAANISCLALSLSLSLSFTPFSFFSIFFIIASKGVFFCHRGSGCLHVQYIHHTQGTQGKRTHEENYCFFLSTPLLSFFPFLTSRHDEPNPTHNMYSHIPSHRVSPIGSC